MFPNSDETRKALAKVVAAPSAPVIAVKPKANDAPTQKKPYKKYVPDRDKPLTINPLHPLIKQADDKLVLRGMAYGTRQSYGQHLRNFFDWLKNHQIEPARGQSQP